MSLFRNIKGLSICISLWLGRSQNTHSTIKSCEKLQRLRKKYSYRTDKFNTINLSVIFFFFLTNINVFQCFVYVDRLEAKQSIEIYIANFHVKCTILSTICQSIKSSCSTSHKFERKIWRRIEKIIQLLQATWQITDIDVITALLGLNSEKRTARRKREIS